MSFKLELETGNAAFDDGMYGTTEIARILSEVARTFEQGTFSMNARVPIRDANGNTVGAWTLELLA